VTAAEPLPDVAEALTIQPGDTLIIRVLPPLTQAHYEAMKAKLREQLPDVDVVIVPAEQMAVYRPRPVVTP
jgi:hypothetical protein